jgi:septal ring factor EnvC (AmiA/AmiB activator)
MTFTDIISGLNFLILLGIVGYLLAINKYLNKNDIVDYVAQIFKMSEANLKQDLYLFLEEIKEEYKNHQNEILKLLQAQQKEVERLKKIIMNETQIFKQYCQERVNTQEKIIKQTENRLQEAQRYIAKIENMLSKCRKKVERLKNEAKAT